MTVRRLVWFRADLRTHDHAPLLAAAAGSACLGVYVFDERHDATVAPGFVAAGAKRRQFIAESVEALRTSLRRLGSDLVIRRGNPAREVLAVARQWRADEVHAHAEVTPYEVCDEQEVRRIAASWCRGLQLHDGGTLLDIAGLDVIRPLPRVFTKFRRAIEARENFGAMKATPASLPPCGERPPDTDGWRAYQTEVNSAPTFQGGEAAGEAHIAHWMWELDALRTYKATRNGMLRAADSSRLSPWLALGCLSPRRVHAEVLRYEERRVANESTYWLIFELLWRDYFRLLAAEQAEAMFWREGVADRALQWREDHDAFTRWRTGQTGIPIVDAAMRELLETGFMSNRARQNASSFLAKTLCVDWRWGAAWFEHALVDYDPANNWGNWQYVAGVGTDPRDRRFNVVGQSERYDEAGEFLVRWLPELRALPPHERHAPWRSARPPHDYPKPIVDLEQRWSEQQAPALSRDGAKRRRPGAGSPRVKPD